jgi:hypothetical protein
MAAEVLPGTVSTMSSTRPRHCAPARWCASPVTLLTGVTIVTIASASGLRSRSFGSQNHQRHLLRAGPGIGSEPAWRLLEAHMHVFLSFRG